MTIIKCWFGYVLGRNHCLTDNKEHFLNKQWLNHWFVTNQSRLSYWSITCEVIYWRVRGLGKYIDVHCFRLFVPSTPTLPPLECQISQANSYPNRNQSNKEIVYWGFSHHPPTNTTIIATTKTTTSKRFIYWFRLSNPLFACLPYHSMPIDFISQFCLSVLCTLRTPVRVKVSLCSFTTLSNVLCER